jgi:hypothetical protein
MADHDPERFTRDVENAVTYPILTEQVSFSRSGGGPTTGISSSPTGAGLGQTAALAIGDVLGWKVSSTDPKGFVGALTQAFTLTTVEGHVESSWNPRTYAVQTDLGGGITGAQASLYTRAKDALDQSLSLLDGLYPLDPDADPEYVRALREMARSQMTEIVKEFGAVGLPSVLRINTYFKILLGQDIRDFKPGSNTVQFDPDEIKGTLGHLRDTYGIRFRGNPFNNSIEDEQDITNFRVISDYMTSLMQSWIANRPFFFVETGEPAFFGTQLVLISRQLNVIAETVEEVRFVLDSVFIGPNERRTLLLKFSHPAFPAMFLEDILEEIEKFVKEEGPRLLRDGGKISVLNNILPVVESLRDMIEEARHPKNHGDLPDGFNTARVRHSFDDLKNQLEELMKLTRQVEQHVPIPEDELRISGILAAKWQPDGVHFNFAVVGQGIHPKATAFWASEKWTKATLEFVSAERIDVTIDNPCAGPHEIRVINPDEGFAEFGFEVPSNPYVTSMSIAASGLNATQDQPITAPLVANGSVGKLTWTSLPVDSASAELTLDPVRGEIIGTPKMPVDHSYSVTVIDSLKRSATEIVTIAVAAPVSIATKSLPDAVLGSYYSHPVQPAGGTGPFAWTLNPVPALQPPSWLSVSSAGVISGTFAEARTIQCTVTVADANNSTASVSLSIHVHPDLRNVIGRAFERVEGMELKVERLESNAEIWTQRVDVMETKLDRLGEMMTELLEAWPKRGRTRTPK